MKSAPTIAFDYRPSRVLGFAAALVCLGAVAAVCVSGLPLSVRVALALAAMAFGVHMLSRHVRPHFHRIARRSSGWALVDAEGQEHAATLAAHVHRGGLLVLDFRLPAGSRFRAVLGGDNLDSDTRRRLILMLARADIAHAG